MNKENYEISTKEDNSIKYGSDEAKMLVSLDCSIFDMKDMLEAGEIYFKDSCRYSVVPNEMVLILQCFNGTLYRKQTMHEADVNELARALSDRQDYLAGDESLWEDQTREVNEHYKEFARVAIQWMKDKNNDQNN